MFAQLARVIVPAVLLSPLAYAIPAGTPSDFLPAKSGFFQARQNAAGSNDTADSHASHDHGHASILADFPVHESCNASQALQIRSGLEDMNILLRSATNHLLRFGQNSDLFELYFGKDADPAIPLGYYTRILSVSRA